eukprot:TRINITY_DN3094_c1_g1_i1.p1 TRINITY_DN3094_c1_g1~~TRINITY_DN3094_c1_g1_i1.p1  ORF type:complete len:179 (+),score=56.59 TRINITY_DN3094_c1_g1_i1:38-538(+)
MSGASEVPPEAAALLGTLRAALGKERDSVFVQDLLSALSLGGKQPSVRPRNHDIYVEFKGDGVALVFHVTTSSSVLHALWCYGEGSDGFSQCPNRHILPPLCGREIVQRFREPARKGGGGTKGNIWLEYENYVADGLRATFELKTMSWEDREGAIHAVGYFLKETS